MAELTAPAPAKVNLVLDILGRRDDGYHELRTVLQTLSLADVVTISTEAEAGISTSGPLAEGVPADESNLAWRAATALAALSGRAAPAIHIHLEKHIPAAAGLGGGASDAATVLRLLQRLWPEVNDDMLAAAANSIGSDEAFFLVGGTALAEGRGERVTPLAELAEHDAVVFVPRETLDAKTATLFRAVAKLPYDSGEATGTFLERHPRPLATGDLSNAFERVAFDCFPGLGALRNTIEAAICEPVRLAGAGPTLFWIGEPGRGDAIASAAGGCDADVIVTGTVGTPWVR